MTTYDWPREELGRCEWEECYEEVGHLLYVIDEGLRVRAPTLGGDECQRNR